MTVLRTLAVALSASILASCDGSQTSLANAPSGKSFPSSGFKSVKFSMNGSQLKALGYSCASDQLSCKKGSENSQAETLFGLPADVVAKLKDNKVTSVSISVGMEPVKMVETYETELGKSKVFEYVAMTGAKMREHYWISPEGTSISVTVNTTPDAQDKQLYRFIGPRAHVEYMDKNETANSLAQIEKLSIKPKDF